MCYLVICKYTHAHGFTFFTALVFYVIMQVFMFCSRVFMCEVSCVRNMADVNEMWWKMFCKIT